MDELEFTEKLIELGAASEFLRWRRARCIQQWAVDDCSSCPVQTNETPDRYRTRILLAKEYLAMVREAIPCWRYARDKFGQSHSTQLALSLLTELHAMTEDESTEPNDYRWVAPPLSSRSMAHVGRLMGGGWGFRCDCSSAREHYSDRVRGGLLVCPCCLAHLSMNLTLLLGNYRETSERLLQQIGWKIGDPAPIIWRSETPPLSWVAARKFYQKEST
jgi:hypothetical protein